MEGFLYPSGSLTARKIVAKKVSLLWKLKNNLRPSFLRGFIGAKYIAPLARSFNLMVAYGELRIKHLHNGVWTDYGVVSYNVITDAGVAFLVDDWDNDAKDITTLHFHGCGTGTNAENQTDTALQTESTTALNPDSIRATGTESQPAANQLRTVGTLTFDASAAVTEHGVFDQAATGGGTLWDRSQFSAINVVSTDSIQFTYTATFPANG
jgi:hypothetical protein